MTLTEKQRAWDAVKAANRAERTGGDGPASAVHGRTARRQLQHGHGIEKPLSSRRQRKSRKQRTGGVR